MTTWNKTSRVLRLSLGNALEWYDFCLYGYFAATIGQVFFHSNDPRTALIYAFGTFAIGSLARPLGGIVFGYLGDRVGRYFAMNLAIILMGGATMLSALLPGYQHIGIAAPVILMILRILQGISAGGQFGNLIVITAEDKMLKRSGFYMGITFAVSIVGFLLASLVSYLTLTLAPESWQHFAWRLPFALGGVLLIAQRLSVRSLERDTPMVKAPKTPYATLLADHKRSLLLVILLSFACGSIYYLVFTYLVNAMVEMSNITLARALELNSYSLLGACLLIPIFGYLSDIWGRRRLLFMGTLFGCVVSAPALGLLRSESTPDLLLALGLLCVMISWIQAAVPPFFSELFPATVRASGCCSAFGIGSALSGVSPFLAAEFARSGSFSLEMLFTVMLLVIFGACALLPKQRYQPHQATTLANESA